MFSDEAESVHSLDELDLITDSVLKVVNGIFEVGIWDIQANSDRLRVDDDIVVFADFLHIRELKGLLFFHSCDPAQIVDCLIRVLVFACILADKVTHRSEVRSHLFNPSGRGKEPNASSHIIRRLDLSLASFAKLKYLVLNSLKIRVPLPNTSVYCHFLAESLFVAVYI